MGKEQLFTTLHAQCTLGAVFICFLQPFVEKDVVIIDQGINDASVLSNVYQHSIWWQLHDLLPKFGLQQCVPPFIIQAAIHEEAYARHG